MATIDKLYKSMGLPMNIKRGNPWPLDVSSLWYSYDEMKAYAEDAKGVAYVGQVLALVDEENNTATAYIIADATGTLKQVGAGPVVDNKTIFINEESEELSLKDFEKRFYKYVPEEIDPETGNVLKEATYKLTEVDENNPWVAGLELRVASENGEFVLGWYEPNPTTIEGVNNQVAGLQTSVADLQKSVSDLGDEIGSPAEGSTAATGLYAKLDEKANKSDVYTKTEIDVAIEQAITSADHLRRKIVSSYVDITTFIDEKGADEASKYIFMVPELDTTADGNVYEEYMVIDGVIEVVGKWATDLTDYVTKDALSKDLANYVKSTDLTTTLESYAKTTDVTAVATELGELATAVDNKVEKEEGKRLITEEEAQKLEKLSEAGEENFVKTVSDDFTVDDNGELSLNKDNLDLSENTTVKALSNRVTNLDTSVSTLSGNLSSLELSLGANSKAIEDLQKAQETTTEAVNKNKKDIEDLNTKAGNLEAQLNTLSGKVTTNGNSIANLEAQLNNYVLKTTYDKDIAEIRDILTWKDIEVAVTPEE